jgi:hypothetical protein
MESDNTTKMKLATTSPEDGLDFACNLVATALSREADSHPERACDILRTFTQYVEFRYVGELELAAQYLADLGREISPATSFQRQHFWLQMQWVAQSMGLPAQEYAEDWRSDDHVA